jgi:FHS family L-fucose permease-like MFS transporter
MPILPEQRAPASRVFITDEGSNVLLTFCLVCSLFLLWGFCNGLIDVMDKHFQDRLHLTKAQSAWVQTAHYLGYALMALPAGLLTRAIGYKGGILSGLMLVAAGGLWFIAATRISTFWAFLLGVSIIAMGLTVLETVANPYATVLGSKPFAALRINLAQTVNGIGWMLGPVVGGAFFYSAHGVEYAHGQLYIPYVGMAMVVIVLAGIFVLANVPELNTSDEYHLDDDSLRSGHRTVWEHPHFIGAVAAQFLYVAAQAGIFSFFINYMVSQAPPIPGALQKSWLLATGAEARAGTYYVSDLGAARLQGLVGFGLFLLGRLTGTIALRTVSPHRLLMSYSLISVALCAIVVAKFGWLSVAAVFLIFFFMSIGFPTIFALGIHGLGLQAKKASAFLVMAILGGALMPKLMGYLGDVYDMSVAFLVPLGCFVLISLYGMFWTRLSAPRDEVGGGTVACDN